MSVRGSANEVDIFLLGKTGKGKSATANSIVQRRPKVFKESTEARSETNGVKSGCCRRLNTDIKVVDGPGLCDTRREKGETAKKIVEHMSKGMVNKCPEGFHSLVLVLKYGDRFTEEEQHAVQTLKSVFGENFVRDFCVVVFTHGDNFDMDNSGSDDEDEETLTFHQWCSQQEGPLQDLLQECDYRTALFYNKTKDQAKSDSQLQELLTLVDKIKQKNKGARYTNEAFEEAKLERERMIVRENAPMLRESIQKKVNFLIDGINKMQENSEDRDKVSEELQQLRQDVQDLLDEIKDRDKDTGVLDSLRNVVVSHSQTMQAIERALEEKKDKEELKRFMGEKMEEKERANSQLQEKVDEANSKKEKGFHSRLASGVGKGVLSVVTLGGYNIAKELTKD